MISPQVNTAGKRKVPSFALAKVAGASWAMSAGYGNGSCRDCNGFQYNNWASSDPWATGTDAKGRIVTVRLKERSVVVRRHTTANSPGRSKKKLTVKKGWFVGGWHFGSDGT